MHFSIRSFKRLIPATNRLYDLYSFKANHQVVILVARVYVLGYRKYTHIIFTKIVYKHCGLRSVPSEPGRVFNDYRVNAFFTAKMIAESNKYLILAEGAKHL